MESVPIRRLPHVFHVGDLNLSDRGPSSYEGDGLSVSLCPEEWYVIARLGGRPTWRLAAESGEMLFLDWHELTSEQRDEMTTWAMEAGFAAQRAAWNVSYFDDEHDQVRTITMASLVDASDEAAFLADEMDGKVIELGERQKAAQLARDGAFVVLWPEQRLELTDAGRQRCRGMGDVGEGEEMAALLWAEDVLMPRLAALGEPALVGLWWEDWFEPALLSAPRGVVFRSRLSELVATRTAGVPDAEETPAVGVVDIQQTVDALRRR